VLRVVWIVCDQRLEPHKRNHNKLKDEWGSSKKMVFSLHSFNKTFCWAQKYKENNRKFGPKHTFYKRNDKEKSKKQMNVHIPPNNKRYVDRK